MAPRKNSSTNRPERVLGRTTPRFKQAPLATSGRFSTTLAALSVIKDITIFNITSEDFEFITSDTPWIHSDRQRARTVLESLCYGVVDYLGYPRFALPVDFVAAVIAYHVHPVNFMTASIFFEGASSVEDVISGVERSHRASEVFSYVLACSSASAYITGRIDNFFGHMERVTDGDTA